MAQSLGRVVTVGVAWLAMQSVLGRVASFVAQLVLAKILIPADFGIFGLSSTVVTLTTTLCIFGMDHVFQQRVKGFGLWKNHALAISSLLAILATVLILAVAAGLMRAGHGDFALVLAINSLFIAPTVLATYPQVLLQARMEFRFLASYLLVEQLGIQAASILLAWYGWGAESFAIPAVAFAIIRFVVLWTKAPFAFGSRLFSARTYRLGVAGATVLGSRLTAVVTDQGDYLVLAIVANVTEVGLYFFAFKMAVQAMRIIAGNLTNVVLPVLVTQKNNRGLQVASALRVSHMLAMVTMPLCLLQALLSEPILTAIFGERWSGAIIYLQIFSVGLVTDAIGWPAGALLVAQGQYRFNLRLNVLFLITFVAAVVTGGLLFGSVGVALGVSFYYLTHGPLYASLVFRGSGLSLPQTLLVPAKCLVISVLAAAVTLALDSTYFREIGLARIALISVSFCSIYGAAIAYVVPSLFREFLARLHGSFLQQRVLS